MDQFGQKLYALRISKQLTLKALATALGYTAHGHISELEAGKKQPTADFALRVSRFFNVTTDELLRDEFKVDMFRPMLSPGNVIMPLALIGRAPIPAEIERLRLILSTFQDGTGQLADAHGRTLPGWRDFERSAALTFNGIAQESKSIFDVLIPDPNRNDVHYGISCKMRGTLNDLDRTGRVTIELSNSAGKFWQALNTVALNQENYKQKAEQVGMTLLSLVNSWHEAVSVVNGGIVDLSKSYYLVLSWNKKGQYQLHLFPLNLPNASITWSFPTGEARLKGEDTKGKLFEWYGESGGQLKYYPLVADALWTSDRFTLEPLPSNDTPYGLLTKVAAYFPQLWSQTLSSPNDN